jgi:hypothetical protein
MGEVRRKKRQEEREGGGGHGELVHGRVERGAMASGEPSN